MERSGEQLRLGYVEIGQRYSLLTPSPQAKMLSNGPPSVNVALSGMPSRCRDAAKSTAQFLVIIV